MSIKAEGIQGDAPEKLNFFSRFSTMFAEMQTVSILRLYRFSSFALSATLFVLFPTNFQLYGQMSLLFLVFASSILMVALYEHYWNNVKVLLTLILFEIAAISLLLAYTGGFSGPFLWYALNPFIVSTAFFSFPLTWLFLSTLLASTYGWKVYLYAETYTANEILSSNYYTALNLIVIVTIMHLFARMHLTIAEDSEAKKSQRLELLSAHQSITENYHVFQGLSNFQREVASYKNQKDIYTTLIDSLINIFPFRNAIVLIPPPDFQVNISRHAASFQIIGKTHLKSEEIETGVIDEISDRWAEFSRPGKKRFVIGTTREWVAMPLRGERNKINAVFVGWIKPRINPLSFIENLSLFINFTEQTTEWISMFKQKERILQHISSIYEAVEAASSQNNPHQVVDLFASYARALTDCDKTIFWMESRGSGEHEDYYPIYSVKGPQDYFPEEEWHGTLLKVWSEIHEYKLPILMDLHSDNSERAQLISVPVKSGEQCLGMLAGIQSKNTYSSQEITQTLSILADLGAIAVERTRAEVFAEKLLIVDEQKRIASEIHDNISQNLFSIVYSIDSLSKECGHILGEKMQRSLSDIKNLSAETARELRALIYRLNPREDANDSFIEEVESYLDKLARMNNVNIKHVFNGNSEYLNPAMCRALFRILKESTGNALRHGRCSEVVVHLDVTPFQSVLNISDNGKGFDVQSSLDLYTSGNRLGLVNMRELAIALQGYLSIKSKPGKGTEVTCTIPTSPVSVK